MQLEQKENKSQIQYQPKGLLTVRAASDQALLLVIWRSKSPTRGGTTAEPLAKQNQPSHQGPLSI
jgi:hypothetical protein